MIPANVFESRLLAEFEWFHRHPELSLSEFETTGHILQTLKQIEGVELLELGLPTGALAKITGSSSGRVVALRADIDATHLPRKAAFPMLPKHPNKCTPAVMIFTPWFC